FTIGQDLLRVNLGATSQLVPEDQFGISGSSRPIDPGFGYKGFRVGVMGWLHDDAELQLGDKLLAFLRDSVPARHTPLYRAGVNDIGATITWPDTRLDSAFYHDSGYSKPVANHVETKTKLPVSYIANLAYSIGNTTLGADVLNTGRGSVVHVGGEQRLGLFAV